MFRALCLLLAVAVVVLAIVWYRTRERRALLALGGAAGLLLALLLGAGLWRLIGGKSDHQQIQEAIEAMAAAYTRNDVEAAFQPISNDFRQGDATKAVLRAAADRVRHSGEVTGIKVWGFHDAQVTPARDGQPATAVIRFSVKPVGGEGETQQFWNCEATFVKEADGQWRLRSFKVFLPGRTDPYPIPQLPN